MPPAPPLLALALVMSAAAAYCDLRTGLIPNRLLIAAAAAVIALRVLVGALAGGAGGVLQEVLVGLFGGLASALVPLLLYRMDGIGGGDVKLLAVLGLALGPATGLEAELHAFALVLVYAPARLLYEGTLLRTLAASGALLLRPLARALMPASRLRPPASTPLTSFRFAPAVFLATALGATLAWSPL